MANGLENGNCGRRQRLRECWRKTSCREEKDGQCKGRARPSWISSKVDLVSQCPGCSFGSEFAAGIVAHSRA